MQCSQRQGVVAGRKSACWSALYGASIYVAKACCGAAMASLRRRAGRRAGQHRLTTSFCLGKTDTPHRTRPVRLRPTARRRDAPRRPHRLGPRTLERRRSACSTIRLRARANSANDAHAATPGSAFPETPKGSRRRPPPPAGARSPAGLAQPSLSEATGGQAEARRLPAVPASVTAAHPQKGPARNTTDVRAHFRPAYHGLQ